MFELHGATVLLQWAVGGMFFCWITTRRREVGLGYGWLLRSTYGLMAALALAIGLTVDTVVGRELSSAAVVVVCVIGLAVSVRRRKAGVSGQRRVVERRTARVAAMTGIDRDEQRFDTDAAEFPPWLDLLAVLVGVPGLIAAAIAAGDPALLSIVRTLIGAAFLGALFDAMLLGHWYLVQPGLARGPLLELVRWCAALWPVHLAAFLWPTGMVSVLNGDIDDGWEGILGWFWVACVVATIALIGVTRAALKERQYSAVMAATGLLYLAILTGFGQDLVARVILSA